MEKPLEITFNDIGNIQGLEILIHEKAARLEKFCDHIISCIVHVERPHKHPRTGSGYHVRIEVRIAPQHDLVVNKSSSHGEATDTPERVVRRAFEAMERQVREVNERQHGQTKTPAQEAGPGVVVRVFPEDAFGFLKTPAGREIYFHANAVTSDDFDCLEVGSSVRYVDEPGDEGPKATTVQLVDKRGEQPPHSRTGEQNPPLA